MPRISVIGGGAWGTALAQVAAQGGADVLLWAREPEVVAEINAAHLNSLFLSGVPLSPRIRATSVLSDTQDADACLVVVPAQHVRTVLSGLSVTTKTPPLVLCAKGIEQASGLLVGEIVGEAAPGRPFAVLSGPTFAHEVASGLPTAITLACRDATLGDHLVRLLGRPTFRPYWTDDVVGAEIGGAIKNVLAIACGIAHGRALGENAKAALITRGFAEMLRFGHNRGARRETLMGLCGLGDLVLTCSSLQSRNMSLGVALGQGIPAAEAMAAKRTVAEGAATAPVLARLAADTDIDMPICIAVNDILAGAPVANTITTLLARPFRAEVG